MQKDAYNKAAFAVLPVSLNKHRVIHRLNLHGLNAGFVVVQEKRRKRGGQAFVQVKLLAHSQQVRAASHWQVTASRVRSIVRLKVTTRKMVCDSVNSEFVLQLETDVTLKNSLEELMKCMLRVWCTEGQALSKLGVLTSGKQFANNFKVGYIYSFAVYGEKFNSRH